LKVPKLSTETSNGMQYCLHIHGIRKTAETTTVRIWYLIQQTTKSKIKTTKSTINNHLKFIMSLLHVSTSTRPSPGRLYKADSVKDVHV